MTDRDRRVADPDIFRESAMREVTIAPSIVADMIGYLRAHDVDADAVCRRAGVDPLAIATSADRVRGSVMSRFWREALAATNDPDLGLHMTVASNPGTLDIVGYVMLSSRTADEALRRGARLMRLLNDGIAIELARDEWATRCRVIALNASDAYLQEHARQIVDTILVGIVHQVRLLTGRPVVPVSVSMRYTRPQLDAGEHERLFGVTPRFGAEFDEVVLACSDVDVELRSANPLLLASFQAHADSALAALAAADTLSGRVSAEIIGRLKGEAPTISSIARALAMSARHLQRGLASEGTSYQALLDDARRELAVRHLASPDATVAKVAWLVGFSEASAFHRAFRRWTGQSPRAVA